MYLFLNNFKCCYQIRQSNPRYLAFGIYSDSQNKSNTVVLIFGGRAENLVESILTNVAYLSRTCESICL
jgi:hypothetical protein